MTPIVSLHLFYDSRTLFLQSVSVPPSAAKMEPRYLYVLGISSSPSFTASFVFEGGMYSVFCRLTFSPCLSKTSLHLSSWYSALSLLLKHSKWISKYYLLIHLECFNIVLTLIYTCTGERVCVCVCVCVCVHACVRACVRACTCVRACMRA